ncbi:MAG TPA: hypothetical protein VGE40_03540 [Bacilli bacterium]
MNKSNVLEKILWSVALPGFGQFLNGKYIKGLLFIALELIINVNSNFNEVIMLSFQGDITGSIRATDYQWLMFYPCVYMFALWDAYRDAGGGKDTFAFVPFVVAAYLNTVGVIYSDTFMILGILPGPIWLPMLFCFLGFAAGMVIQKFLKKLFVDES